MTSSNDVALRPQQRPNFWYSSAVRRPLRSLEAMLLFLRYIHYWKMRRYKIVKYSKMPWRHYILCIYACKKNIHPIIKKKHMFVLYIFEIIFSAKNFSNLISEKYMNCGSAALILLNKFLFFWTKFTFKLITETECTANVMWCVTWSFKAVC